MIIRKNINFFVINLILIYIFSITLLFCNEIKEFKTELDQRSNLSNQTIIFSNGDKYIGEIKDGKPHGKGKWFGSLYDEKGIAKYTCDDLAEQLHTNFENFKNANSFIEKKTNFVEISFREFRQQTFNFNSRFPNNCFYKEYGINFRMYGSYNDYKIPLNISVESSLDKDSKNKVPLGKNFKKISRKNFTNDELDVLNKKNQAYITYEGEFKNGKVNGEGYLNCIYQRYFTENGLAIIEPAIINSDIFGKDFYLCNTDFFGIWENGNKTKGFIKREYKKLDNNYSKYNFFNKYLNSKELSKGILNPRDCFVLNKVVYKDNKLYRLWDAANSQFLRDNQNHIRILKLNTHIYYGFVDENDQPDCFGVMVFSSGEMAALMFEDGKIKNGVGLFLYPPKDLLIELPLLYTSMTTEYSNEFKNIRNDIEKLFDFFYFNDIDPNVTTAKNYYIDNLASSFKEGTFNIENEIVFSNYRIVDESINLSGDYAQRKCKIDNNRYVFKIVRVIYGTADDC